MMTRPPKRTVSVMPCEASTRSFRPLGGCLVPLPPQAIKLRMAHKPTTRARLRFFKRQAPNNLKKGYLVAKSWIITDRPHPAHRTLRTGGQKRLLLLPAPARWASRCEDSGLSCILSIHGGRFSIANQAVPGAVRRRHGDAALCKGHLHQPVV